MKHVNISLDQAKIALECVTHSINHLEIDDDDINMKIFSLQRSELMARLLRLIKNAEEF